MTEPTVESSSEIITDHTAKDQSSPKNPILSRETSEASPRFGLLNGINYSFDDMGFIDWRDMIPEKFLFINEKKFTEAGKEPPKTMENLDDSDIIIKLGGIKWLARLRGYEKVSFELISGEPNVVVKCSIDWIPSVENPLGASYEEIASCGPKNAEEFNLKYAESIAANRAFVRCVRNFLNVNIVGEEEIFDKEQSVAKDTPSNSGIAVDPQSIFIKIAKEKGMDFPQIVDFCSSTLKIADDSFRGHDEASLLKAITPKQAKTLLRAIKKT